MDHSHIQNIKENLFIYRDDFYPFLGGGNKARKMMALHEKIKKYRYNAIVTTGGIQSNHCRATALYCKKYGLQCTLVLHGNKKDFQEQLGNAKIVRTTNSKIIFCDASEIANHMNQAMEDYSEQGFHPYYLQGGGHTLEGGMAYVKAISEIVESGFIPESIFIACGTGSTQAGLLAGISKLGIDTKVFGISVGRKKERAENVVNQFYQSLCTEYDITYQKGKVIVDDEFLCGGYQNYNKYIEEISNNSILDYNVFLDTTYTGKAFYGMSSILNKNKSEGNVLFWYTGGIFNFFAK